MKKHSQQGIALVITLIMLSIITFLAVAFLAVTRRDKASVAVAQNQTDSRLFSEMGAARAQSEIIARMLSRSNLLIYDTMVSRNFINPNGFDPSQSLNQNNLNNVNYDRLKNGGTNLTLNQIIQNIGNLFYDPRVPVFVDTNTARKVPTPPAEFRYYLDLNRNGIFDSTTNLIVRTFASTNGVAVPGDPEWIGILANPLFPHSPTNRFIGRYAYFVVPVGKTLDLNFIHNYAKGNLANVPVMNQGDRFLRSQGFGSWEINLGAFLYDLNTNIYGVRPYNFRLDGNPNTGDCFDDALAVLRYRYQRHDLSHLGSVRGYFADPKAGPGFSGDFIDGYATTPIVGPPFRYLSDPDTTGKDKTNLPWPGSDNTNRFMNVDELFDPTKTSGPFVNRLRLATNPANTNVYDRYTYYRLASQLGVDSAPELLGKIHLNYSNDVRSSVSPGNFVPWTALGFFTNTAERLVRSQYPFGITNIPVYPTNYYTPGVHRMLQVAANLYDATTNRSVGASVYPYFPSVFRPIFIRTATNLMVGGYVEVSDSKPVDYPWFDMGQVFSNNAASTTPITNINIYGQPWVIGAKKGYPNFNENSLQTAFSMSRKLEFLKAANTARPYQTNQMYIIGVSNLLGAEAWNSYTQAFPRALRLQMTNYITITMTNATGVLRASSSSSRYQGLINAGLWPGMASSNSFFVPLQTNFPFLIRSKYQPGFRPPFTTNILAFDRTGRFPVADFTVNVTNKLMYALIDDKTGRIVDLASFADFGTSLNINEELNKQTAAVPGGNVPAAIRRIWLTNRVNNANTDLVPTLGVNTQIGICMGTENISDAEWKSYNAQVRDKASSIRTFQLLMNSTNVAATNFYAPFDPFALVVQTKSYQANDPLVHYTIGDLIDPKTTNVVDVFYSEAQAGADVFRNRDFYNIGRMNRRYSPWEGNPQQVGRGNRGDEIGAWNVAIKDPLIRRSDDWDFPTNRFPSVGWIGRVHRGTPWQTIYLKSDVIDMQSWVSYWVNTPETHPTNDWRLADYFTVAPNDNAARGLLSVNQDGIAAWSAVLSGVLAMTNTTPPSGVGRFLPPTFSTFLIQPNSPALHAIVDEVNALRLRQTNQVFQSIGDILAATNLTVSSLYLNPGPAAAGVTTDYQKYTISDAAYESIPQQILSLLRLGEPRFVIYSYGQSLKPADQSLVLNPPNNRFFNLCTNYQITGEVVTRTVMKVTGSVTNPTNIIESYTILPSD